VIDCGRIERLATPRLGYVDLPGDYSLMLERLFDEYPIAIVPLLTGSGRPLLVLDAQRPLNLLYTKAYPNRCLMLRYANASD
jgi:hypothetical protein